MFTKTIRSASAVAALFALAGAAAHAQTAINPILEYNFNDTANKTTTLSTGSETDSSSVLNFIQTTSATSQGGSAAAISAVDLHSAAGAGVSGMATDYAFNNTSVSTMVTGNNPSVARNAAAGVNTSTNPPGGPANLVGLVSFTVTGWFKTDNSEVLGGNNNTRLVTDASNVSSANNAGFYLSGTNQNATGATGGGSLQFSVNNSLTNANNAFVSDTGVWTFFAATYDSVSKKTNLYRGNSSTAVTLVGSGTATGVLQTNADTFGLGNIASQSTTAFLQRDFDGFMDDVRIYGASDSTAALSQTQLQTVLMADQTNTQPVLTTVVAAPEPSQAAVLGLGVLGLTAMAFRARKRQGVTA